MGSFAGKNRHTYIREALHAGSWYDNDAKSLGEKLEGFLSKVDESSSTAASQLRGLIVPHAGYSYSGPTAAYAFHALKQELQKNVNSPIKRILVLHPSHHVYLDGCAVSGADRLATPVGDLIVDDDFRREVLSLSSVQFSIMKKGEDEAEHSGEMQYPYLAKILKDTNRTDITVLPIMCGALSDAKEESYGKALHKIIAREDVCTVVSSDFCHWGGRFNYKPVPDESQSMPIHEFIKQMDQRGMDLIQLREPGAFADYLKETKNTICGRHAIAVWLHAVANSKDASNMKVEFVRYAQSSHVVSKRDSSVSYAAAKATITI
jgi:AmmeMemoRadiSam system protein B